MGQTREQLSEATPFDASRKPSMTNRRAFIGAALAMPILATCATGIRPEPSLQSWADLALGQFSLPGSIVAVRLPGGQIHAVASGFADVEGRAPMQVEHRLLGASMGKTFVSALCMRLQRAGDFSLGDRLSTWLGAESWFGRLPNGRDITLRNLLNHSSGLRDFIEEPGYAEARAKTLRTDWVLSTEQKISLVLDHPPLFAAGEGYSYSDTNYILLGMVIERALGQDYFSVVDRYFIKPRNLTRTSPSNARQLERLAVGYTVPGTRYDRFGFPRRLLEDGKLVYNPATEWTGGGFISNPIDWVRWLHSLFDGSSISSDDIPEMMRPARREDETAPQYRGAGFKVVNTPSGKIVGHHGSMAGYSGFMGYLPRNGVTFSMQANVTTFDRATAETSLAEAATQLLERYG